MVANVADFKDVKEVMSGGAWLAFLDDLPIPSLLFCVYNLEFFLTEK